jgi:hypothetical protein
MRWIKGDTRAHIDRCANNFDTTYLAYLNDSKGSLVIDGNDYSISRGKAYSFSEGLMHETIGTGMEPRLLLGPMSEQALSVGGFSISADGETEIVYIRTNPDPSNNSIEYKINNSSWVTAYLPAYVGNTNASPSSNVLKIYFTTDITLVNSYDYFFCGSDGIQFGSTTLNNDGSRPKIIIDSVTSGYPGLIGNGNSTPSSNYSNIYVYNLEVNAVNGSTLASDAGWIGQTYFGIGKQDNYFINCSSNGPINEAGGGIVGGYAGSENGSTLYLTGCSSIGDISGNYSGGIVGYYAGRNGGSVTCESCWSTGEISGTGAGGIFGLEAANGNFGAAGLARAFKCYSTGSTSGINSGGIFGQFAGTAGIAQAEACYSLGAISGGNGGSGSGAGGIYGSGSGSDGGTASATNCYSNGIIFVGGGTTNGIFSGGSSAGRIIQNCYITDDGWTNSDANSALTGTPNYPSILIGTTWAATGGINYPYELNSMGYTPYSLINIVTSPAPVLKQSFTQTIQSGQSTSAAIKSGQSYDIFKKSGGNPSSYGTITMDNSTGVISTTSSTEPGTYTITLRNIGSYNFTTFELTIPSTPISDICFPAGTPILTDQGYIPIDKINIEKHTIKKRKIEGIVSTKLTEDYVVCFEKNALELNVPCKRTIISANHLISYRGQMVKAKEFLRTFTRSVYKIKYNGKTMYNVLMEKHGVVLVNNMVCETLDPKNDMAKLFYILKNMSPENQMTIVDKINREVLNKMNTNKKIGMKNNYQYVK